MNNEFSKQILEIRKEDYNFLVKMFKSVKYFEIFDLSESDRNEYIEKSLIIINEVITSRFSNAERLYKNIEIYAKENSLLFLDLYYRCREEILRMYYMLNREIDSEFVVSYNQLFIASIKQNLKRLKKLNNEEKFQNITDDNND